MDFSEVIGQEETKQRLLKMAKDKHVPHALLFCGPYGSGKMALAMSFASYLLETSSTSPEKAKSMLKRWEHPDLHFTYPTIKLPNTSSDHQPTSNDFAKDVISGILIIGLTIVNIFGVNVSKFVNNLITISKLVPLALFIAIGIFFINGANFTPVFPQDTYVDGSFAQAAVLLFFAYTGFEVIAIAAEDMKNPKKNLPRAIIMCMLLVSVLYMAILAVSIGVLGTDLANTKAPVQDAFNAIVGPVGMYIVLIGTLISMGGINFAEAYYAPRVATSMAEDGMLPSALAKRNRYNAPYVAAIVTAIASVLLAWSGSFTTLAAISAVSRFTQYLPTCLAVIIFRRKWADKARSYTIPGGYLIPVIAIGTSLWMLAQAQTNQLLWGLGGCIVILPFYYSYWKKKKAGLIKDHDEM